MKTATATWITYNNYGTLLQAYALQKAIEKLGHENYILNDQRVLEQFKREHKSTAVKNAENCNAHAGVVSRLASLAAHPGRIKKAVIARTDRDKYTRPYEESQKLCGEFKETSLKIYSDIDPYNLEALNDRFDAFIAGSDQVWSAFESIFNPYYFLEFANKRKISYAPSLGTDKIPTSISEKIKELLSDFYAVSARERISAEQLTELTGKNVEWVADPTLLHDGKFWHEFASEVPERKKKYLLCYFLENREWYFDYAYSVAKKLGLKIVLIPNNWDYISSEYVTEYGVGPKEFVSLFEHADYVLTDSYHGSIFSLIFEKDFQYFLRFKPDDPASQNIRIESLFGYLQLNNIISSEHGCDIIHLNHSEISTLIEKLRKESWIYIGNNLTYD